MNIPQDTKTNNQVSDVAEYGIGKQAYFWFTILTLIYILDMADRNMIGAIYPALKAEMGFSDGQLGAIGAAVQLGIVLFIIPTGYFIDRWSRTKTSAIMAIVWSLATASMAFGKNFMHLFVSRFIVGAGEAGYNPASYALISAWFPQKIRGTMTGIFHLAQPLGGFIGVGLAGYIAQHYGWRNVFGFFAVPGLILGIIIWFAPDYKTKTIKIRDEAKSSFDGDEIKPSIKATARHFFQSKTLMLLILSMMAATIWGASFTMWAPSFYGRTFNLDMAASSQVVMFVGLFAAIGPFVGGVLADKMFRWRSTGRILAIIMFLLFSVVLWSISFIGAMNGMGIWFVACFWAVGNFMMAAQWGIVVVVMMELVPPQYRGTLVAFTTLITYFIGAIGGLAMGALSDAMGLINSLLTVIIASLGTAIVFLTASMKTFDADYQKIQSLGHISLD